MQIRTTVLVGAVMALAASPVSAQLITNSSINSYAEAQGDAYFFGPPEESDFDSDLTPATSGVDFPASASASASTTGSSGDGSAQVNATFTGGNTISANGTAFGSAYGGFDATASGWGDATFSVTFDLTATSDFTLDWLVFTDGTGNIGNAYVSLTGPSGTIFSVDASTFGFGDYSGTETGTLGVGTYTLYGGSGGAGFADDFTPDSSATGDFDLELVLVPVPGCPGDVDGDGDTDVFDFGALASAFGTKAGDVNYDPDADLTGDNRVDVFDFSELAADFGCTP